jgi:hypothetical protein
LGSRSVGRRRNLLIQAGLIMALWDNGNDGNSWLDQLADITRGATGIVTQATEAFVEVKTNLNNARQLNIEQAAAGQAAGTGPVTARQLLSGGGHPGDFSRYIKSKEGRQMLMLGLAGLAAWMLVKA